MSGTRIIFGTIYHNRITGTFKSDWSSTKINTAGVLEGDTLIIGTHSESNAAFFLQKMKFIKARPAKKVVALKKSVDKKINEPKKETTQVMLKFQELLNNSSFTRIFVLASEEPSAMFFTDSFYN